MKKLVLLGLAFALLALKNRVDLGLNDVSVLLPYEKYPELFEKAPAINQRPDPALFAPGLPALALDREAFVPAKFLREIDNTLQRDQEDQDEKTVFFRSNKKLFEYRLTSFRFDPCANLLEIAGDEAKCRHEFRLVWQHVEGSQFDDNNIHAIHVMNDQQWNEIIATLRELKQNARTDSIGLPLQPNPTIVEEGLDSAYYKGMIGLVHRYIRASNLIDVAFLADTNQNGHWPMLKLGVNQGKAKVLPIPGTEKTDAGGTFFVQRMDGFADLLEPTPIGNAPHNLFRVDSDQMKFDNAFALENPRLHGPDSLDCVSCHRANLEKEAVRSQVPNTATPAQAYQSSRWDLTVLFGIADVQSMQLFSYFHDAVKIAPRTIHESAEVADFINGH